MLPGYDLVVETDLRLLTLIFGMEMRWLMVPVEHPNHDSEEG